MFVSLATAVEDVLAVDPSALSDAEVAEAIVALHTEPERLLAARAKLVAEFDNRKLWADDGARNGAAWISWKCRVSMGTARREIRVARALQHMPLTADAWSAGEISHEHVVSLCRVRNPRTWDQFVIDEEKLVDWARNYSFKKFASEVAYWLQEADPNGCERDADRQRAQRAVYLSQSFGGLWFGDITLDPLSGAAFNSVLSAINDELFALDWAEASRRDLGETEAAANLFRTPAQRRADALVEMARRAATAPRDGKAPRPLFTVLVDYQTASGRVCELANGIVVTPGQLAPWFTAADFERVVFGSPSRVIDVSKKARLFTGGTRRAVQVRDRDGCFHETCQEPPDACQVDHIIPFAAGGPTVQSNGRCACAFHNRARNGDNGQRPPPPPS